MWLPVIAIHPTLERAAATQFDNLPDTSTRQPFDIGVVTIESKAGTYPSVGAVHPPAIRLRAIRDLYGLEPLGLPDQRRWLDHGRWGVKHPLGDREKAGPAIARYPFLPTEGESLHQIAVGPVHAGIIEPGHFRFTASGETVVRLEEARLCSQGYQVAHGRSRSRTCGASGRTSLRRQHGCLCVAFVHAVEAALNVKVPPRAAWLRALMAEIERLANHFGDFGAISTTLPSQSCTPHVRHYGRTCCVPR